MPAAACQPHLNAGVHLASLREPRLEEFPAGGGSNKLKARLRIRNLAAVPVLAKTRGSTRGAVAVGFAAIGGHAVGSSDLSHDHGV